MKKIFLKVLTGLIAFMMLFASLVLADGINTWEPIYEKNDYDIYEFTETSIEAKNCEKVVDKEGKVLYYKYVFNVPQDAEYGIEYKTRRFIKPVHTENGTELDTGIYCIYYNSGTEPLFKSKTADGFGTADQDSFIVKLKAGEEYCMYFSEDEINDGCQLNYRFASYVIEDKDGTLKTDVYAPYKETGFRKIEKLLSRFLILVAKCANWMLASALNKTLTMDDIVFNSYDEIRLDYFNFGIDGNLVTSKSNLINALKGPINTCYAVFMKIAIIGYIIILVYLGIQMLLNSTSADKKASAKKALTYWFTGVIILFFYPYVMKYVILLDDAFVQDIAKQRTYTATSTQLGKDGDDLGMLQNPDEAVRYDGSSKDYMSQIGLLAQNTLSLSVAFAYLILTWQLIMMLVYYYKRAFTVAFLMMVFPLVALTYVIDKLNDGKSQALSTWTREFVIDVVIQIFHAIVYIFVANTIYATIDSGNMDNILVMIAATFMFEGENIMKQIFGGGKTISTGSVAKSGAKIAALASLGMGTIAKTGKTAIKGAKMAGKGMVIAGSAIKHASVSEALNRHSQTYRDYKIGKDLLKKDANGITGFDRIAENPNRIRHIAAILPSSGNITQNINDTAEAIESINNGKTTKDVADGLYKLQELYKKRKSPNGMTEQERKQFDAMMRVSDLSLEQFENIQNGILMAGITAAASPKPDYKRINQNLRLTVEYAFSDSNDKNRKMKIDKFYAAAMYNLKNGYVDRDAIENRIKSNWEEKRESTYQFGKNVKYKSERRTRKTGTEDSMEVKHKMQVTSQRFQSQLSSKITDYENLSTTEKEKINDVSDALSYITLTQADQTGILKKHFEALKQDFGTNQQVIEEFINSHIDVQNVQAYIDDQESLNRGAQFVKVRAEGLKEQYIKKFGKELPDGVSKEEFEQIIEDYARLESLGSGEISASEAVDSVKRINASKKVAQNISKIATLDAEIDFLQYMVAKTALESNNMSANRLDNKANDKYKETLKWSREIVEEYETRENPRERDPVTSIYDIINAAKKRGEGRINSVEELYRNSAPEGFIDVKTDAIIEAGKDFARKVSKTTTISEAWKENWELANNDSDEQPMVLGHTYADYVRLREAEASHKAKEAIDMFTDITVKPATTIFGGLIGMALADDGMPLGEGITGMVAGATAADKLTESVSDYVTRDSKLQTEKNEIRSQVDRRLKKEEKERLKARQAFADAEASADDTYKILRINYVSANYYKNSDDAAHVTIKIIADNATLMSIGEPNNIGAWVNYEEDYDYELINPQTPYLFIRLRDDSGNVVNETVKIDNPDAK